MDVVDLARLEQIADRVAARHALAASGQVHHHGGGPSFFGQTLRRRRLDDVSIRVVGAVRATPRPLVRQ